MNWIRPSVLALMLPLATLAAQTDERSPQETVPPARTLQRHFDAALREWNDALIKASREKDNAARSELMRQRPERTFAPRFEAGAKAHAGTAKAVPYLTWLVSRGGGEAARTAMSTLMKDHVADPGIRMAVARIAGLRDQFGVKQSREWLDRVLAENHDPAIQAQARYTRASAYVGTRAVAHSEELRKLAISDLEKAIAGGADASLRGLAERLLFEAQHLEPGLAAPEIAGEDLDGVGFKLSDYRGKVVLLDFWGDW